MSYDTLRSGFFGWNMQAWIDAGDGEPPRPCQVRDISDNSARIDIAYAHTLPENLVLLLTQSGSLRRPCRVVARDFKVIEVRFG